MAATTQGFRLSPQQKRLWALGPAAGAAAWCLMELDAPASADDVAAAVTRLARRHDILRTTYSRPAAVKTAVQVVGEEPLVEVRRERVDGGDALAALETRELARPFDLEAGPVARAILVEGSEDRRWLLFGVASLAADAATLGLLREELAGELSGGPSGAGGGDGEIVQYAQYAQWRAELLDDPDSDEELERWRQLAPDLEPVVRLPRERPIEPGSAFAPTAVEVPVPADVLGRMDALAERLSVEPGALLLAGWMALLSRLTGAERQVVGVTFDGRMYEDLAEVVGRLAETVPVSVTVSPELRFADLARRVSGELDGAAESQEYFPAEELLAEDRARPALAYGFEIQDLEPASVGAVTLTPVSQAVHDEPFVARLVAASKADGVVLVLELDRRVVADAAADAGRLTRSAAALLSTAFTEPETPVERLPLLSADDRSAALGAFDATRTAGTPAVAFHELFEARVRAAPDDPAVIAGERRLTYGELDARANRLARRLLDHGVGPETVVGLHLSRSPALVEALLAVSKAGGAYLPLDPLYPPERLRTMVESARPRVVLADGSLDDLEIEVTTVLVDRPEDTAEPSAIEAARPEVSAPAERLAYVLFTSGSTGRPKGVMVSHPGLVNYLLWSVDAYGLGPGDRVPVHSPFGFDLTVTSLLAPLVAGATVELLDDEEGVDDLAAAFDREGELALVKLTPVHLELLASRPSRSTRVRTLVVGGEALFGEVLERWWKDDPNSRVWNEYGPTETVVGVAVHRATAVGGSGPVPVGRPIDGVSLRLLDRHLEPVPDGVPGELYVGGVAVTRGYVRQGGQTAERFVPDPFADQPGARLYRTGDLMSVDEAGDLVYLRRVDQQLKIRGIRVEPAEVEMALRLHGAVRDAVVTGWDDGSGDRRLVAYLLAVADETPEADELRRFLLERLPEPMVPSLFLWMSQFPLTPHGKVDRAELPPPGTQRPDLEGVYVAPETPLEILLADIWAKVLGIDRVGVEDSFFALGGDSIRSVRLVADAHGHGIELTVQDLFRHQTIRRLIAHLEAVGGVDESQVSGDLEALVGELEQLDRDEVRERIRQIELGEEVS